MRSIGGGTSPLPTTPSYPFHLMFEVTFFPGLTKPSVLDWTVFNSNERELGLKHGRTLCSANVFTVRKRTAENKCTWVWHQLNVVALEDQLILLASWHWAVHPLNTQSIVISQLCCMVSTEHYCKLLTKQITVERITKKDRSVSLHAVLHVIWYLICISFLRCNNNWCTDWTQTN